MSRLEHSSLLDRDDTWSLDHIGERTVEDRDLEHPAVAAPHTSRLILNDLSDAAVELSSLQLERNGFAAYDRVVGRFEEASLPAAEIAIGSFLVYDAETLASMTAFMERTDMPVVLANDPMEAFDDLLHACGRRIERLTDFEDLPIVRFCAGYARP